MFRVWNMRSDLMTGVLRSSAGQLASACGLFAFTFIGATALGDREYAMWVLLTAVTSVTMSLDLGASSYVASVYSASASRSNRVRVMAAGNWLNVPAAAYSLGLPDRLAVCRRQRRPAWVGFGAGIMGDRSHDRRCSARGSLVVAAQAAMAARRFRLRDQLLIGQTAVAIAIVWPLVEVTPRPGHCLLAT